MRSVFPAGGCVSLKVMDLRRDTVTQPIDALRRATAKAEVGADGDCADGLSLVSILEFFGCLSVVAKGAGWW